MNLVQKIHNITYFGSVIPSLSRYFLELECSKMIFIKPADELGLNFFSLGKLKADPETEYLSYIIRFDKKLSQIDARA